MAGHPRRDGADSRNTELFLFLLTSHRGRTIFLQLLKKAISYPLQLLKKAISYPYTRNYQILRCPSHGGDLEDQLLHERRRKLENDVDRDEDQLRQELRALITLGNWRQVYLDVGPPQSMMGDPEQLDAYNGTMIEEQRIMQLSHRTARSLLLKGLTAFAGVAFCVATACAGPLPPVHREQDLPEKYLARPVVIYNRPYTGAIYADYVPDRAEVKAEFVSAMARNEYEPMQVGLYVPTGKEVLKNVTLEVKCPVPCSIGHIYYTPAEELSWTADTDEATLNTNFPNMTWPVDVKRLVNKRSSMPMYVLPVSSIAEIRPGRSAAFWVTFQTDKEIPAGAHEGTFTLSADGKTLEAVPFVVKVHPFALPRPKVHYGMYYMPYQTPAAFQGPKFQKLYLADMAAHGMNLREVWMDDLAEAGYDLNSSSPVRGPEANAWGSTSTRQFLDNYLAAEDYQPDGGYNALKLRDNQIRMGREAGLIQHDHPCIAIITYKIQNKSAALANMRGYAASRNMPYFHQYMHDEPGPGNFAEVNRHVGEWRRLGVTGIAAMNGLAAFGVGRVHSVWTVIAGEVTPEMLREAERLGAEVWTYDCFLRTTNIEASRFNSGLYTWSLGLKGNIPYAYMGEPHHQPHFDASWKLSGPSVMGYVIPSPAGPVPGVGFEGRREGVDDVRYLQLLEARVIAARANNPTTREAKRWLASLRVRSQTTEFCPKRYNAWAADFMDPNSRISPEDYHTIRARAAAFILKLPSAPGELNPEPATWLRMRAKPLEADAFAKASIDECLKALKRGTIKQKRQAAGALATRTAEDILPARELLISLLDVPEARMVALRAMANLGQEAAPSIPALRKLLAHKDAFVRTGATYTLALIGRDAADALALAAKDSEIGVADLARGALDKLKKQ